MTWLRACGTQRRLTPAYTDPKTRGPETDMTETPEQRKKLIVFGLCVFALSVFMYVSFIAKVALDGP